MFKAYAKHRENVGVDTAVELANRKPEDFHPKLLETNEERKLGWHMPSLKQVQAWVEEAKKLPRKA